MLAAGTNHQLILIAAGRKASAITRALPRGGWKSIVLPSLPEPIWEQVLLPFVLLNERVDIFHRPSGPGGLLLRMVAGPRVVVTVHDVIPLMFPADYFRNAAHQAFYRFQLALSRNLADAVITVSRTSYKDIITTGRIPARKVAIIPEAVDRSFESPPEVSRETLGWIRARSPYLLAMGGAEPRKNMHRVVAAFEQLSRAVPHHLIVVGGSWRDHRFSYAAESDLPGRIHSTGTVDAQTLRALYAHADLFVYPSLYEGFGLPVLEAMASGVPVLVSRDGALPEVAGDAAIYVDATDIASIAAGILEVVSNPSRAQQLIRAGKGRLTLYSWQHSALRTLEIYEKIA